jgi:hypothetical protein
MRAHVPAAPMGVTLAEHLRTLSVWVVEEANYCIRLGAAC